MEREVFIKRITRYLLLLSLAAAAFFLGSRTASGNDCSGCAGKGICRGEVDCKDYLNTSRNGTGKK